MLIETIQTFQLFRKETAMLSLFEKGIRMDVYPPEFLATALL